MYRKTITANMESTRSTTTHPSTQTAGTAPKNTEFPRGRLRRLNEKLAGIQQAMLSSPDKLQQRKLRRRCIDLDHRIGLEHQRFRKRACRPKPSSGQLHQPSRGLSTGSLQHLLLGVTRINHPELECTNEQSPASEGVYEQTTVGEEITEQMTVDEEASKMGAPAEMAECSAELSVQCEAAEQNSTSTGQHLQQQWLEQQWQEYAEQGECTKQNFDLSLLCDNPEDFKHEILVMLRNQDPVIRASAELADTAGPEASQEVVDETVASRDVFFGERHGYQLSGSYIKHQGGHSTWQYVCAEEPSFIRSASSAAASA